jgi:MSHA biogenesis protein MshG
MPQFSYRGRRQNGDLAVGSMDAPSSDAVAGRLMEGGVIPLNIVEKREKVDIIDQISRKLDLYQVSIEELLMFTRQMTSLIRAGVPVTRAIGGIRASIRNPLLIDALDDTNDQLEAGRSLSVSFARHPKVFNNLYVSMIQVGENTGKLDQAFGQLASYIERNRRMSHNISAALRYPKIVISAIVVAVVIVNLFVIPKFASFFESNNLELPWQTLVLLNTSNFFVDYWHILLGIGVAVWVALRRYLATDHGRLRWHQHSLRLPVVGDLLLRAYLARFARSFAMAYGAGVPIVQAMGVIARSVGNDYISVNIGGMREGIERGESLTMTAQRTGMFTPVVMQMFAVGEEAGNLEEMMEYVAGFYEEEVDYDVKTLSDKLEPVIYVFVAILVLILALGIFVPMWDVAQLAG